MQKVFGAMREKGKGRLIPPFWRLRELKMTFSNAREGRYGTYSCTHPHALRRQRARIGISTNAGSTMLKPSLKPFQTKVQDNSPGSLWTKTVAVALHFFNILPFQRDPRRQFVGAFKLTKLQYVESSPSPLCSSPGLCRIFRRTMWNKGVWSGS